MNDISRIGGEGVQTMSSREIAELTGKQHDNVRRDIQNMAEALSLTFEEKTEGGTGGRPSKVYLLPKRETLILVSGYNLAMRARIIDRWQQLEEEARQPIDPMRALNDPATMRSLLLSYSEKMLKLESQNAELTPKAEALDRIAYAGGSLCITDAAKALQVRPKDLFAWLQANHWIYRRPGNASWLGYQDKVQIGYLEHKLTTVTNSIGEDRINEQVRVTPKGMAKLAEKLNSLRD